MEQKRSETVKASFNLPKEELDLLREVADRRNINVTQALRQAIAHEAFLADQVSKGSKVLLDDGGRLREVVLDPSLQSRASRTS